MAKKPIFIFRKKTTRKRPGIHSKNASRSQSKYKKKNRGQGK